jgi:hypothetical protein
MRHRPLLRRLVILGGRESGTARLEEASRDSECVPDRHRITLADRVGRLCELTTRRGTGGNHPTPSQNIALSAEVKNFDDAACLHEIKGLASS